MGKIVYLMGKSATGKDTVFKELLKNSYLKFQTVIPYTTRPIRAGEVYGVEYYFTDESGFQTLLQDGKVIEHREYQTCHGMWRYFTVDDHQMDLNHNNYLMIGTLESYEKLKVYYGEDVMLPILIELEDGIRLQRALNRERRQTNPRYEEMCRRFLADSEDFQEEKVRQAGIDRRFCNLNLQKCLQEIGMYIRENLKSSEVVSI